MNIPQSAPWPLLGNLFGLFYQQNQLLLSCFTCPRYEGQYQVAVTFDDKALLMPASQFLGGKL